MKWIEHLIVGPFDDTELFLNLLSVMVVFWLCRRMSLFFGDVCHNI